MVWFARRVFWNDHGVGLLATFDGATIRPNRPRAGSATSGLVSLLVLALLAACGGDALAGEGHVEFRLRVQWGGGEPRLWDGRLGIEGGLVERFELLGHAVDEAAAVWIDQGQLRIQTPTTRSYQGVDLLVSGPPEAELVLEFEEPGQPGARPRETRVSLESLIGKVHEADLDDQGNWVQIRRAPGDRLRVRLDRPQPLFTPGELVSFEFRPVYPGIKAGTEVDVDISLERARGGGVVQTLPTVRRRVEASDGVLGLAPLGSIPGEFVAPEAEGVYEISCKLATRRWNLHPRLGGNWLSDVVVERRVAIVVLATERPANEASPSEDIDTSAPVILRIDPAHPGWRQQISRFNLIPGWNRGPLGAGTAAVLPYDARNEGRGRMWQLMQLGTGPAANEPAWQAFPLRISRIGGPHLLEIDYPRDLPQTMGISVLDPGSEGRGPMRTLASGLDVPDEAALQGAGLLTHRVLFWPQSPNPLVLVSNQRPDGYAVFGELRVRRIDEPLQAPPRRSGQGPRRWVGTWLREPAFTEALLADEPFDRTSGRGIKDWTTFLQGGERLIGSLHHRGQNLLMLTVAAGGHTIYPSDHWRSGSRHDTGTLGNHVPESLQRDGLELVFRQFNRHPTLGLVPVIRFDGPLPAVETMARRRDGSHIGLDLVGPDGRSWRENPQRDGPLYNPLDDRVQEAMVAAVRDLALRGSSHPAFWGVGLEISWDCSTQLPGVAWGIDDRTVDRFARETGHSIPGDGPERFQQRTAALAREPLRRHWLQWRANRLAGLFHRMQSELRRARPEARLVLLPHQPFASPEGQRALRQSIPQGVPLSEPLLTIGLWPQHYEGDSSPWLVRPYTLATAADRPLGALSTALDHSGELDQEFARGRGGAVMLVRAARRLRLPSFEAQDPFKTGPLEMSLPVAPVGWRQRQAAAQAVAAGDPLVMIETAHQFSHTTDSDLRPLWRAWAQLPAQPFRPLGGVNQPVVARTLSTERETYIYLVNDSPWPAKLTLEVNAPANCQARRLGSQEPASWSASQRLWKVPLEPYEFRAVVFDSPAVRFQPQDVDIAESVRVRLEREVNELADRVAALRPQDPDGGGIPVTIWNLQDRLENAGFETSGDSGQLVGWVANRQDGVEVELLPTRPHTGKLCCRLASTGPIATLASPTFEPPQTGVVLLAAWIRTAGAPPPSTLRLAIEATHNGKPYYRIAPLGGDPGNPQLGPRWHRYLVTFQDLPLSGLRDMRIRFDLMGAGEVWIDDVQLASVLLSEPELVQLRKTMATARFALGAGRWSDVHRLLAGFWPRQLADEVSLVHTHVAAEAAPRDDAPPADTPPPQEAQRNGGWYNRLWNWW